MKTMYGLKGKTSRWVRPLKVKLLKIVMKKKNLMLQHLQGKTRSESSNQSHKHNQDKVNFNN